MKIIFLTGSHTRHAYMARCFAQSGYLAGLVIEERESSLPEPPEGLKHDTKQLFIKHFKERLLAEEKFFTNTLLPDVPLFNTTIDKLNSDATLSFINKLSPDIIVSYGVHKLSSALLANITALCKWNIHGGLSPWYRGVTTHFWPSYFLEPQMTGMTMHQLTDDIDGGGIIHQTAAELVRGDGIHDLSCRAVISLGQNIPALFDKIASSNNIQTKEQTTTGRIWRSKDWRPEHLHLVYDYYENRIVDHYLNGLFANYNAELFTQI